MVRQADRLPAAVCVELGMHCLRMDVEALAPVALRLATAPARPSVRPHPFVFGSSFSGPRRWLSQSVSPHSTCGDFRCQGQRSVIALAAEFTDRHPEWRVPCCVGQMWRGSMSRR